MTKVNLVIINFLILRERKGKFFLTIFFIKKIFITGHFTIMLSLLHLTKFFAHKQAENVVFPVCKTADNVA